jgi:hypothetical protein
MPMLLAEGEGYDLLNRHKSTIFRTVCPDQFYFLEKTEALITCCPNLSTQTTASSPSFLTSDQGR